MNRTVAVVLLIVVLGLGLKAFWPPPELPVPAPNTELEPVPLDGSDVFLNLFKVVYHRQDCRLSEIGTVPVNVADVPDPAKACDDCRPPGWKPKAKPTGPAGKSNRSPARLAVTSNNSCWLVSTPV